MKKISLFFAAMLAIALPLAAQDSISAPADSLLSDTITPPLLRK